MSTECHGAKAGVKVARCSGCLQDDGARRVPVVLVQFDRMQQHSMCIKKYDLMACVGRTSPITPLVSPPPHARVTSLHIAQQDKGSGEGRHRLGLDVTWKWMERKRCTKKSLIVVDKLKDRAAHGGGDVAFVARG